MQQSLRQHPHNVLNRQSIDGDRQSGHQQATADTDTHGAAKGSHELMRSGRNAQIGWIHGLLNNHECCQCDKPHAEPHQLENEETEQHGRFQTKTKRKTTACNQAHGAHDGRGLRTESIRHLTENDRTDGPSKTQGEHGDAHLHGAFALGTLNENRCKRKKGENSEAAQKNRGIPDGKASFLEKCQGNEWIFGTLFNINEPDARYNSYQQKNQDLG